MLPRFEPLLRAVAHLLRRVLPRSLQSQVLLLTSACMGVSILAYGGYRAQVDVDAERTAIDQRIAALAKNIATISAHFIEYRHENGIESVVSQLATVDGIYAVSITDITGKPLAEVVNHGGAWSARYGQQRIRVPSPTGPASFSQVHPPDTLQRDFLEGGHGSVMIWQRIDTDSPVGWVRVSYRLDTFDIMAATIRWRATTAMGIAMLLTIALLWLLLRPSMRALRRAADFASRLDQSLGETLPLSYQAAEIEALERALNIVSARLLRQNTDLMNQKFALDQHAIVSITDLQGTILYANDKFCDVSGYAADELIGQNHRIIKSGEHAKGVYRDLWQTIGQGRVWHGDIKNRKKNGDHYWVSATIVPLLGQDGMPYQYIGIRTDITANKDLEYKLQIASDQAQAATLAKGQFLANMSHEIRTPMNAVLGMLKLLHNTDLTPRQHDYTTKAESAAHSLLGLLNDILDFSKIEAGKMTLDPHPFRIDKLLRDLSVILSTTVGNKPVEVLFDIDPSLPRALVGDPLRLQQVLLNLCNNAVKFTEAGEVLIRVRVLEHQLTQARLQFSIRDTGIGISPEDQKSIFDSFSQAEGTTTRRYGGTGLGLPISRKLIELMGGELTLYSVPKQGSTFGFEVTLQIDTAHVPPPRTVRQLMISGLKILIIDDNPTAREVIAAMAQSLGWHADITEDGEEAVERFQANLSSGQAPYQALFVDWQMAHGFDGWATIRKILALCEPSRMHGIPPPVVIMITAFGREMLNQRPQEDQQLLHGYLVKPVTASMLFDAVADALSSRQPPAPKKPPAEMAEKPLQGLRLLVVEDNQINQQVARELLSSRGAEVTIADDGQQSVDLVQEALQSDSLFDAVLMDIQMPVMDGYTATRILRQDLGLTHLPIIAMTANAMASDRDACLAAGMDEHVGKPFNISQLTSLIVNLTAAKPDPEELAVTRQDARLDEPPVSVQANRPKPVELPKVDEVDLDGALERFGGDEALYARILQSFLSDIRRMPDEFELSIAQGELLAATRLAHTLKGLAATVGASYLAAVALQTETSLKNAQENGAPPAELNMLCVRLRNSISLTESVMERISRRYTSTTEKPTEPIIVNTANTVTLMGELRALLQTSDMRAFDVFDNIRTHYRNPEHPDFQALATAMGSFDFAAATQACEKLIDVK
ncbi:PAS domain-containing hybrid sensor histidine kinase/response regulator [Candidatus Symbiobacter mobilis]|uniref:Sensory/regulatory protein RpfC n=1 Tax=Candidatus Symbiobacter mobilis CR TaxID=946483 RepID=U5N6W4_9BURK|nr:response regulator [Candidatus Symbiobacter mobilis]AGX87122.1 kinase-like protein [Candidatus Symbiobacter mobilis CR]